MLRRAGVVALRAKPAAVPIGSPVLKRGNARSTAGAWIAPSVVGNTWNVSQQDLRESRRSKRLCQCASKRGEYYTTAPFLQMPTPFRMTQSFTSPRLAQVL